MAPAVAEACIGHAIALSRNTYVNHRDFILAKEKYGIDFIIRGFVQGSQERLRTLVQMTDTNTNETVWSDVFDFQEGAEIFDVQDAIIERIVSVIVGSVERDQVKKLANAKPENLEAYDFVLQGLEYHRRSSLNAENNRKALSFFNKAIEADPNYARAHAWKTCSLANNAEWFQEEMPDGWMDEALASVNKAMDLDPDKVTNNMDEAALQAEIMKKFQQPTVDK